jgi:hypothetical protein
VPSLWMLKLRSSPQISLEVPAALLLTGFGPQTCLATPLLGARWRQSTWSGFAFFSTWQRHARIPISTKTTTSHV